MKIANLHMRAHALEGRLYRKVIEEALAAAGLGCELLLERDLFARAAERLGLREDALKKASGRARPRRRRWVARREQGGGARGLAGPPRCPSRLARPSAGSAVARRLARMT